jgi:hypothetical protein
MMAKYDAFYATATRLIGSKGTATTIVRNSRTMRDPITQTGGGAAIITSAVKAVGLPAGKSAEFAVGTLEKRNISEFYIAHDQRFTPQPGDEMPWGDHTWKLVWTATYDPAADGAIFTKAYGER